MDKKSVKSLFFFIFLKYFPNWVQNDHHLVLISFLTLIFTLFETVILVSEKNTYVELRNVDLRKIPFHHQEIHKNGSRYKTALNLLKGIMEPRFSEEGGDLNTALLQSNLHF